MKNPRRHLAGGTLRLTASQWESLSVRMHEEGKSNWIMSSTYQHLGAGYDPCIAITVDPDDHSTLIVWLSHIIDITAEPQSNSQDMDDLRYLADQVRMFKPAGFRYPTYYLPIVTVEKGVTE